MPIPWWTRRDLDLDLANTVPYTVRATPTAASATPTGCENRARPRPIIPNPRNEPMPLPPTPSEPDSTEVTGGSAVPVAGSKSSSSTSVC
ncbi:MAG: hypothetical protein DMF97_21970 [Acidobacteria bacterium]|nr:MAG: hypothetical protein DMF97_21970 [Acidobacteriota bacterium]